MSITISGPPGSGLLASGAIVGATAQRQIFTSGVGVGASPPAAMLGVIGADSLNTSFAGNISGATGTGLVVTNAGNVGIGTTGPSGKLHVNGGDMYFGNEANAVQTMYFRRNALTVGYIDTAGPGLNIYAANNYNLNLGDDAGTRLTIKDGGNVGIGTTSPTAALHLPASSTARASLRIPAGTAPTSPNAGDVWAEGTVLKFFNGTITKEIAFV